MKRLLILAIVAMAAVSCGPKKENQKEAPKAETPKVLVLYYSQTSNTKAVATEIATRLGADIEEIVPTKPYDEDFQATTAHDYLLESSGLERQESCPVLHLWQRRTGVQHERFGRGTT